jgi:hypothetical protein
MNTRFGMWNVSSLCGKGSLKTVASGLAKCNEVRWIEVSSQPADESTF